MLVYADGDPSEVLCRKPLLNREASLELAQALFPKETLVPQEDGDLSYTNPPGNEIYVGHLGDVAVLAAKEFARDRPSRLLTRFLTGATHRQAYLHAMHSVSGWFAYAHWKDGQLVRSLSLCSDMGVLEDVGSRRPFEKPYWEGKYPVMGPKVSDAYPFPFHPLDMGEAALNDLFGYQIEGSGCCTDRLLEEPEMIPLLRFKRKRSWRRLWL